MPGRVMFLTRSWPRLSQTFIVNEVLALEALGVELDVFALTASGEELRQPQVARVRAQVRYLDRIARPVDHLRVALRSPWRYLATVGYALRHRDLCDGYATVTVSDCFRYAVHLAAHSHRNPGTTHVHAHFMHDPALVALLVGRLTGLPFSVTAHARDLYQIPRRSLQVRADAATEILTCCRANVEYLEAELDESAARKVRVIHHGVDLGQFAPDASVSDAVDAPGSAPVEVVTVGRLVEKKGFPDLMQACAAVSAETSLRLTVYGDGPLREDLERLREELGLEEVVTIAGEVDSSGIVAAMHRADVFAITPFVTADGDRDGVPNVVVEALASGLPVLATDAGGVGEAVLDGHNGFLVAARDVAAIAAGLRKLVLDAGLRADLGHAARTTAEEHFNVDRAARELVGVFGLAERS